MSASDAAPLPMTRNRWRLSHLPWQRIWRYSAGSVICFAVAEATFVLLFEPHVLGARGASIAASVAGIVPGYALNRRWTWGRRERSDFWREVVPYWATAIFSTLFAAWVIGMVNAAFSGSSREARTAINALTYMATYGVLFVAKYVLFDRILFADRTPTDPAIIAATKRTDAEPVRATREGTYGE